MHKIQFLSVLIQEFYQLPSKLAWVKLRKHYNNITGQNLPYPLDEHPDLLEALEVLFESYIQEDEVSIDICLRKIKTITENL
jgi:hypothetical protein